MCDIMIEVLISNKEEQILYQLKSDSIDFVYKSEYIDGDKIIINKKDTDYLAVQLDDYIAESII